MFLVPIAHPGITLRRITMLSGSTEFCEEFLDDVDVGDDAVVGEVNGGWAVASRQLYHERRAVGQGSEFASGAGHEGGHTTPVDYADLAEKTGQADNERVHEMAGRVLVHRAVAEQLIDHVYRNVRDGVLPPAAGTLIRLFHSETVTLDMDTALAIAGTAGVVGEIGEGLRRGCGICRGRMSPSAAAQRRWPATSSANGCWDSHGNTPPTAGCRSIRCGTARRADPNLRRRRFRRGPPTTGIWTRDKTWCAGLPGGGDQHTVTTLPARPVPRGGQRADARRSEVGDPAEVDRQRCYAGAAFDRDLAVQGGCGDGVDVAADDDVAGVADHRRRIRS